MRSGCVPGGAPEAANGASSEEFASGYREEMERMIAEAVSKDCGTPDDGTIAE
jgi:hypothetical protein